MNLAELTAYVNSAVHRRFRETLIGRLEQVRSSFIVERDDSDLHRLQGEAVGLIFAVNVLTEIANVAKHDKVVEDEENARREK